MSGINSVTEIPELTSRQVMNLYKTYGFKIGTCYLTHDGKKKNPRFIGEWWTRKEMKERKLTKNAISHDNPKNLHSPDWFNTENTSNALYIKSGRENNITVIDLDNLTADINIKIDALATACSGLIVRTYKGKHFYFTYDETLPIKRIHEDNGGTAFDIQNNGALLFMPPSHYYIGEKRCEYNIIHYDNQIRPMSAELKELIVSMYQKEHITQRISNIKIFKTNKQICGEASYLPENIQYVRELLDCVDCNKLAHFPDWQPLLELINNLGEGKYFSEWAMKFPKFAQYKQQMMSYFTRPPKNHDITIGSLIKWACEGNPKLFAKIFKKYNYLHFDDIFNDIYLHDNKPDLIENEGSKRIRRESVREMRKHKTVIIKASTGCGKSYTIKKYYIDASPKASILSVSAIRSLASAQEHDFEIQNYLKCKKSEYTDRLIISFEQICSVKDTYDIVILDELTSLLEHVNSPTMKKRRECYEKLTTVIKNADRVVCCDASITDKDINTIKMIRSDVFFYVNNYQPWTNVNVIMWNLEDTNMGTDDMVYRFLQSIEEKVKNQERLVIMSDSKKVVIIAQNYVITLCNKHGINADEYVRVFTSDTGNIDNLNSEFFKDKCIIYSPKVLFGVNIDDLEYGSNQIYAIYKTQSINALGMLQQLGRIRQVNGDINLLWMPKNYHLRSNKYMDEKKYANECLNKYDADIEKIKSFNEKVAVFEEICKFDSNPVYKQQFVKSCWYDYLTSNNKQEILTALLRHYGYNVENKYVTWWNEFKYIKSSVKPTNEKMKLFVENKLPETDDSYLNAKELINNRKMYLNISKLTPELKEIITDNSIYDDCRSGNMLLFNTPKQFDKLDLHNVKKVMTLQGLSMLTDIEKMGEIERLDVVNIKNTDKLVDYMKSKVETLGELLYCSNDNVKQRKASIQKLTEKLNEQEAKNIVCKLYNLYGDFFTYKRVGKNKITTYIKNDEFVKLNKIFFNQKFYGQPVVDVSRIYDGIFDDE